MFLQDFWVCPWGSCDSQVPLDRVSVTKGQSAGLGVAGALPAGWPFTCQTPTSPPWGRALPGPSRTLAMVPSHQEGGCWLSTVGPQLLGPQVLLAPLLGEAQGAHGAAHRGRLPEERGSRPGPEDEERREEGRGTLEGE